MSKRQLSSITAIASSKASKARHISDANNNEFSSSLSLYKDVKFLLKSEPDEFSLDKLRSCEDGTSIWDGIRNPQARNNLRLMKRNDLAYFYYSSNKKETGIHGLVRVVSDEFFPDPSAVDPKHKYFDPKCTDPTKWSSINIKFVHQLDSPVLLSKLKDDSAMSDMALFKQSRLSVQPIKKSEADHIFEAYIKPNSSS
jgi:predicted RNA-binding protein with PUA-like domain